MGIMSDVAMVFTKELYKEIKDMPELESIFKYIDHFDELIEGQVLVVQTFTKFYKDFTNNPYGVLFDLLDERQEEFYILEVCAEYEQKNDYGELDPLYDVGYTYALTY